MRQTGHFKSSMLVRSILQTGHVKSSMHIFLQVVVGFWLEGTIPHIPHGKRGRTSVLDFRRHQATLDDRSSIPELLFPTLSAHYRKINPEA